MNELKMICTAAGDLLKNGEKVAMATVVGVKGSAYRRPGARMIVNENGKSFGMIGGGCFDADVKEVALEVLRTGKPKLRLYDMADDHVWGLGLGCNGSVYVLIESLASDSGQQWLKNITQSLKNRSCLWIQHHFSKNLNFNFEEEHDDVIVERVYSEVHSKSEIKKTNHAKDIFHEFIELSPRLIVFGAGHDAIPLVELSSKSGFDVTVVDQREVFLNIERFPNADALVHAGPGNYAEKLSLHANDFALFMSHRIDVDAAAFEYCSKFSLRYFGFLGPKRRAENIMHEWIKIDRVSYNRIKSQIFAPIGLDLGAETAEEVALSVVAELMAVKNGRNPNSLREKNGSIHEASMSTKRGLELKIDLIPSAFACSL